MLFHLVYLPYSSSFSLNFQVGRIVLVEWSVSYFVVSQCSVLVVDLLPYLQFLYINVGLVSFYVFYFLLLFPFLGLTIQGISLVQLAG